MNLIKNLRLEIFQKNIYQNIIFFSLVLAPIGFAAGPVVMEILIFAANLSFVFLVATRKANFYSTKKVAVFLISYLTIIFISSLLSINLIASLKSGVLSFRFIIFILAGVYLLNNFKSGCKYLFYTYFCIILFFITDAYIQFFFGKDIFLISPINEHIITGMFGDEKKLGSFLSRMIPVVIGLSAIFEKKKSFSISVFFILFSLPIIFFTQERITLIFTLCSIIFLIVYFWNEIIQNIKKSILLFCLLISIPVLFYNLNVMNIQTRIIDTKNQIYPIDVGEKRFVFWSIQHQSFAQTSIEIFKKNKLFGSGIKSYRENCNKIKLKFKSNCSTHPHNIFFQLLSETGLIGILLYLAVLSLVLKELILFLFCRSKRAPSNFFLLSFFFYFNPIFPSGQFFNNWYMGIGTFPLIFYFYYKIKKKNNLA